MNPDSAFESFDCIVIGGGQGGALARMLAQDGHKTALIEKQFLGGTCVNIGCTPTKTLAFCARVAYLTRRAGDYGVKTGPVEIDWPAMRERARKIVAEFRAEICDNLHQKPNLELIFGAARFVGEKQIEVELNDGGTRSLQSQQIIIAAGARPVVPPLDGLGDVPFLNEESLMNLDELPPHLVILGGGYLAVEFGQMFRRFGSQVTIIEAGPQLLAREDADIAIALTEFLREDGVEIHLQCNATSARKTAESVEICLETGGKTKTIRGSHLLVAVGRQSNADTLNLAACGIETDDEGNICVNEQLETNVPDIYALGDIKGGPLFTHIAYDDARILCANLSEGKNANTKNRHVPYTVFTDPQLGRIGLSENEAREAHCKFRVAHLPMSETARGVESDETCGFWKVLVEYQTDLILGGAFLSIEGGEMATILQVAMMGGLPYSALRDGIFSHPTLGESLNNLFLTLDRRTTDKM